MSSPRKNDGGLILPLTRVKTIMKSSPDVESISSDALYYVTKAAVRLSFIYSISIHLSIVEITKTSLLLFWYIQTDQNILLWLIQFDEYNQWLFFNFAFMKLRILFDRNFSSSI